MQEINIDGVGRVQIRRSEKARRLNISVRPFKGVRVSVPSGMSYNSAAKIVYEKSDWIIKALEKVKEAEKEEYKFNRISEFDTRDHKLEFIKSSCNNITVRIIDGRIRVIYPEEQSVFSKEVQFMVRKGIIEALRIEAKKYLPDRVEELANKYGFRFNKLTLKNIKSRWGSCSRANNINLSIHLMTLPDHLIDYVILHELVHTRIKNHGPKFWKFLNDITGKAKKLDKELKKYKITLK